MRSSVLLSLTTLGITLATIAAPGAGAQARNQVIVCRDGSRFNSTDIRVCDRHRGVDSRATDDARGYDDRTANGRWDDRRNGRNGRNDRDDRYDNRDDRRDNRDDRWDNRRDDRGYGYGYGTGRREVYEWAGIVDKEIVIQIRGNRAYVQPIGDGDSRSGRGRMLGGLPQTTGTLVVQRLEGRGDVDVVQQPSPRNGYTATVRVRDPRGGAERYRIVAYWEPVRR